MQGQGKSGAVQYIEKVQEALAGSVAELCPLLHHTLHTGSVRQGIPTDGVQVTRICARQGKGHVSKHTSTLLLGRWVVATNTGRRDSGGGTVPLLPDGTSVAMLYLHMRWCGAHHSRCEEIC